MRNILLLSLFLMATSAHAAGDAAAASPTTAQPAQAASAVKASTAKPKAAAKAAATCPTGCVLMNCPPPGGDAGCCKKTTSGYVTCPVN